MGKVLGVQQVRDEGRPRVTMKDAGEEWRSTNRKTEEELVGVNMAQGSCGILNSKEMSNGKFGVVGHLTNLNLFVLYTMFV